MRIAPNSGIQSVIVLVPAAESAVGRLRTGADPWALRGMPPHVTVAGHWPVATVLPLGGLESISASAAGMLLTLDRVDLLGDAVCLLPEDDAALLAIRRDVLAAIGVPDAKDDGWRPHLTVCRRSPPAGLRTVREELAAALPIRCAVSGLAIVRAPDEGRVTIIEL